jgi:hypothetical protein
MLRLDTRRRIWSLCPSQKKKKNHMFVYELCWHFCFKGFGYVPDGFVLLPVCPIIFWPSAEVPWRRAVRIASNSPNLAACMISLLTWQACLGLYHSAAALAILQSRISQELQSSFAAQHDMYRKQHLRRIHCRKFAQKQGKIAAI